MTVPFSSKWFTLATAIGWVVVVFLLLPLIVVVPVSFTDTRYLSLPTQGLSLRHYVEVLTNPAWVGGFWHSAIIALVSAVLATIVGTAAAVGCWRLVGRTSSTVRALMMTPMIVPPIVHALGFYRVWVDFGLIDTFTGMIIAHAVKGVPFVVITVSAALANFDHRIELAARSLGCTPLQALRYIIIPSIKPGLWAGAALAFITSWDEVVVMLFITSRQVQTLPRRIWDGLQDNLSPAIAAVATLMIVATFVVLVAREIIVRRNTKMSAEML